MLFKNQSNAREYRKQTAIKKIFFLTVFIISTNTHSIVPVDSPIEFQEGWSGEIGLAINGQSGNKDKSEFGLSSIFRYSKDKNLFLLITGYDYDKSNDVVSEDELYVHGRWVNIDFFKENIDSELFVQHEYDEFSDISGRTLFGGGARFRTNNSSENSQSQLIFGTGAFYEKERSVRNNLNVETVRANFYSKYVYQNKGEFPYKTFGTVYVQPSLSEVDDYRLLAIGGFEFSVSKNFKVVLETEVKHNSTPFENIEKTDFEYGVKLAYQF